MDRDVTGKELKKRNKKKFKKILEHLSLLLAIVVYVVIGALVFQKLEHPAEISKLDGLLRKLEEQRFRLKQFSHVCSHDLEKCKELLDDYEIAIIEACQGGLNLPLKSSAELSSKWSFPESAFFASTVLTTIGYGNTVPNTFWGRLFCILFAFIGIPLTLSVIADMGVLMATALSTLYQKAKFCFPNKNILSFISPSGLQWISALGIIMFLVLYLSVGAMIFMMWEDEWGFFEGFYFCFITMTTIGFGDLVPKSPNHMFLCTFYILTGLALTSTIIELLRRQYARSWERLQALTGPLTESLKRLAENPGMTFDVAVYKDLKNILNAVNDKPKKSGSGKDWSEAFDYILQNIFVKSEEEIKNHKPPQILQIVIYESSV